MLLAQDRLGAGRDVGGAAHRGALGQLHHDEEGALVVLRQEPRGGDPRQLHNAPGRREGDDEAEDRQAHDAGDRRAVAVAHGVDAPHDEAHDARRGP